MRFSMINNMKDNNKSIWLNPVKSFGLVNTTIIFSRLVFLRIEYLFEQLTIWRESPLRKMSKREVAFLCKQHMYEEPSRGL